LLGDEEIAEVTSALRSDWITTGPRVARFEADFAERVGAPAALALSSGTAGLHVALCALGIGPGDRVVSTPMTFCSSIHVIEQVGAVPLLVDVEPDTLNLDPDRVAAAVERTPGVRAIEPVHLYGHPCEMDALLEVAGRHGLALVEDAAHALPAAFRGRRVGAPAAGVPDLTAFSFYATKNMTTGEGGMLTGPPEAIGRARTWSLHGMSRDAYHRYEAGGSWYYEVVAAGFKYNMTDIQAALGIHQLRRLEGFQARRREIVARYDAAFAGLEELELPARRAHVEHAWHLYVIRLHRDRLRVDRAAFIAALTERRIGTSVHFIPIHLHPYYRDRYGFRPEDFPVASREYERIVSLPLYPRMSDRDVEDVIEAVTEVVRQNRR
ncbi:MAG TPA: DegT/DnrJ/EryC1/StrS aminotransferase family protein, partial [Gemmataceae bacterium]|nr:DegT/DnrJ/EryC1/StrS aminotransferase family protein [Gemmataceae bacterium]